MNHPIQRGHRRIAAFAPVPLRRRAGGWSPARQAAFLAQLALTGSVREAARRVRMSRETAYRLRGKPGAESFADAWDRLTGRGTGTARKVTPAGLRARALGGLLKPLIYRGRHVATVEKADNSALLRLNTQFGRGWLPSSDHGAGASRFAYRPASTPEAAE